MKCPRCKTEHGSRKKYEKIKQNIEICITCGYEMDVNVLESEHGD